ncbi:MAG: hypothetical protein OK441_05665 [Thaumarchaeota archaeon]|nr:hypothetical protein [Nitrososphaerota archaeon]
MNPSWPPWRARGMRDNKDERTHEACLSLDLVSSLALASMGEFCFEDLVQKIIALRRAVPFEVRDGPDRVISSEDELRKALPDLLQEGLCSGWIEAVTMRHADWCRQNIPIRLRELEADEPGLKDTLDRVLAQIRMPQASR